MPLPSIKEYAPKISTSIFTLLHKYSGSASGETFEMIQTAFKVNNNVSYLIIARAKPRAIVLYEKSGDHT
jgi:hypothetical protein